MDNKQECKIPECGGFPGKAEGRLIVGAKQLRKAVLAGKVRVCYLANDADPGVTEPLAALCAEHGVQVVWMGSMAKLGRACGIEVSASAAGVAEP